MDFFISYTGRDVQWAEWIAWELEKEGYDCVLQAWDFAPGEDFIHQMQQAAESSKQTIAVLSPDYLASDYVQVELSAALAKDPIGRQRSLVPVRVRPCEPTGLLRGRIYIDLVDQPQAAARQVLLDGIRASLVGRRKPEQAVRFPAMPQFPGGDSTETPSRPTPPAVAAPPSGIDDAGEPVRVLFLASSAGIPLDLAEELRQIQEVVRGGTFAERIAVTSHFDVTAEDLFHSLNAVAPTVLHFSGSLHGGSILLHSADGGVKAVNESSLVGLVRALDAKLRLVFLNACHSLGCARALAEVTGCAIGVDEVISDRSAIAFARAFYRALAYGQTVGHAHEQARIALEMDGVPDDEWPVLCEGRGVDSRTLRLIA